ncbi:DMT family transporter [Guggenheimella bovis]
MKKFRWIFFALLACLLWGSAFGAVKSGFALFQVDPSNIFSLFLFAGTRFSLAGLLTLIIGLLIGRGFPKVNREDVPKLLRVSLYYTFFQYVFFYIGLSHTSAVHGSIIASFNSFLPVVLAHFFLKDDPLNQRKLIAIGLGVLGIITLNLGGSDQHATLFGDVFMFLATLSNSYGVIVNKKSSSSIDPFHLTSLQLLIGGLGLLILGVSFGGRLIPLNSTSYALMAYLGLLSALAVSIWTALLSKHDVSKLSILLSLVPVFGVLGSFFFMKEDIFKLKNALALLFIVAGILYMNMKKRPTVE